MDVRLQEAINAAEYRLSYENQQKTLKDRTDQQLMFFVNGGSFTITYQLISFIHVVCSKGRTQGVLIDDNGIPIRIENIPEFADNIIEKYFDITNQYHADLAKLKKSRGK